MSNNFEALEPLLDAIADRIVVRLLERGVLDQLKWMLERTQNLAVQLSEAEKKVREYEPRQPEHMLAIDLLVQWLEDRGGTATRRDLLRAHVAGVRTAKDLDALLERYESVYPGCVREETSRGGRRVVITSPRYIQRDAESGRDTVDKHPNRRPSRDRTRGAHIGALP